MIDLFKRLFGDVTEDQKTYLIAGLGNPGRQYKRNRHNAGFMLLDVLAARLETSFSRLEMKSLITRCRYGESRIILAKPQTYMNNSGQAIGSLLRYYKIPHSNLFVCYDDVDLELGTIRIRGAGGAGGQKGMASIINNLSTQDFARLRVGISRPPGRMEASDYVLQDFSSAERELLGEVLELGADAALMFVSHGINETMNRFNRNIA